MDDETIGATTPEGREIVLRFRVTDTERQVLDAISNRHRMSTSEVLRLAIANLAEHEGERWRYYYSPEQLKEACKRLAEEATK